MQQKVNRYTEAAKVNINTQNAMGRYVYTLSVYEPTNTHALKHIQIRFRIVIFLNRRDILSRSLQMTKIQHTELCIH